MYPSLFLEPQIEFHHIRKWRFDFGFKDAFLAVEIQGYGSGHNSYEGMKNDYAKHNAAISLGWSILYLMSGDLQPATIQSTCKFIATIRAERLSNDTLIKALTEVNNVGRRRTNKPHTDDSGRGHWKVQLDAARRKFSEGTGS